MTSTYLRLTLSLRATNDRSRARALQLACQKSQFNPNSLHRLPRKDLGLRGSWKVVVVSRRENYFCINNLASYKATSSSALTSFPPSCNWTFLLTRCRFSMAKLEGPNVWMEPIIFFSCGSLKFCQLCPYNSFAFFPQASVKFCSSKEAAT